MVTITVIGWYGTETIGDRGILAGILGIFFKCYGNFKINLGSMYPFFTERTLREDNQFYNKYISVENLNLSIFDSTKPEELNTAIENSDIVAIGGGPLMDLDEMHMLRYAFNKAKKMKKKTVVLGCGVGPIQKKKTVSVLEEILSLSDLVILRDKKSIGLLSFLRVKIDLENIVPIIDPAVFAAHNYRQGNRGIQNNGSICINLRDFQHCTKLNKSINNQEDINRFLSQLVYKITIENPSNEIKLLPNHYFGIGGDDRIFMNYIKHTISEKNLLVQNIPLSLEETLEVYSNASYCLGMRFHTVVFQSLVNGNNYILDYTDSDYGKITGFLEIIDKKRFYSNRYLSLGKDDIFSFLNSRLLTYAGKFSFPENVLEFEEQYISKLKSIE
jgi:polysaccharide pyruvyl transferase WcaK-like protein